jgi:hypothetical protein
VSALMRIGVSAQVAVRGSHEEVVSALTVISRAYKALSGMITIRGDAPLPARRRRVAGKEP